MSDETLRNLPLTQHNTEGISDETLKKLNITKEMEALKKSAQTDVILNVDHGDENDSDMYTDIELDSHDDNLVIDMHKAKGTKVTTYVCPNTNIPTRQVIYHSPSASSKVQKHDDGFQIPKAHQKRLKQRKRRESQRALIQSLKGFKPERKWILYLKNILKPDDVTEDELSSLITKYCKLKGIDVISAQIIYNRFSNTSVGCKITVPQSQASKAKEEVTWPDHIECRDWKKAKAHHPFNGRKFRDIAENYQEW